LQKVPDDIEMDVGIIVCSKFKYQHVCHGLRLASYICPYKKVLPTI